MAVDRARPERREELAKAEAERVAADRCATGAIVWWEHPNLAVKGAAARRIVRNEPLPLRVQ